MSDFTDSLTGPLTSLALCWRIRRPDGVQLGFTNSDKDIVVDGKVYLSAPSFNPSALIMSAGLSVDTIELAGVLSHKAIRAEDLAAGRYDSALITVFIIDWQNSSAGSQPLSAGRFGTVRQEDQTFTVEVRGLTDGLDAPVVEAYSPECRAEFGDQRCRINLRRYRWIGSITQVIDTLTIQAQFPAGSALTNNDDLAYGRVRWLSGANDASDVDILTSSFTGGVAQIGLRLPMPNAITVGDRLEVTSGCDKRYDTCRLKFNNRLNFRGEPFVPGVDSLLAYPNV